MYSIAFPNIFNGSKVNLTKDYDAVKVNLKSLLMSNRGGLFGDPYYGVNIKKILWAQAEQRLALDKTVGPDNTISEELLKDEIFNAIYSYMPQISIKRDNIDVHVNGNYVEASIEVVADSSIPSNLFDIKILVEDEEK